MLRASQCCCSIHTWLEVCALTVPSRLLRAMSAYAERKAAYRGEGIRLNIANDTGQSSLKKKSIKSSFELTK